MNFAGIITYTLNRKKWGIIETFLILLISVSGIKYITLNILQFSILIYILYGTG